MLEKSPIGLAALDAQIESAGAALREIGARLQTIKVTATAIHSEATRELQALKDTLAHRQERDDLDRIVPLKEAAKMRGVSVDTLRRTDRDKFIAALGQQARHACARRKDAWSAAVSHEFRSGASSARDRAAPNNEVADTKPAKALEDAWPNRNFRSLCTARGRAEQALSMSANIAPVAAGQVSLNDLIARIRDAHISVDLRVFQCCSARARGRKGVERSEVLKEGVARKMARVLEVLRYRRTYGATLHATRRAGGTQIRRARRIWLGFRSKRQSSGCRRPRSAEQTPTGQQAPERGERGKPIKRPTSAKIRHTDIIEAWIAAPATERTRALDGIGLKPLLAATPPDWWPLIERHLAERQKPPMPTVTATDAIPDDLSIPQFLQRAPAAALLKVGASI